MSPSDEKKNQADRDAKAAGRAQARASRPGAVSVAGDEAARLDQRIEEKTRGNVSPERARGSDSTPASLKRMEQDVNAKQRAASGMPNDAERKPGAFSVAKSSATDSAGGKDGGAARSQLDEMEARVQAKTRAAAPATTPGAVASLNNLEDRINAKVRSESPQRGAAAAPGAHAALNSLEDRINAKVRSQDSPRRGADNNDSLRHHNNRPYSPSRGGSPSRSGSPVRGGSPSRSTSPVRSNSPMRAASASSPRHNNAAAAGLNQVEDRIAAKIRREGGGGADTVKEASLRGMENSVAAKQQRDSGTARSSRPPSESLHADVRASTKSAPYGGGRADSQNVPPTDSLKKGGDVVEEDYHPHLPLYGKKVECEQAPEKAGEDYDHDPLASHHTSTPAYSGAYGGSDLEYGVYDGVQNEEGLAIAVPVMEDDDDVFIPSAVEYDPDAKPPIYRNRRFRLYAFLACFVLIVTAIGAGVGVSVGKSDDYTDPLAYREELGIKEAVERIIGPGILEDALSPYTKALQWIMYKDPMELTPDDPTFAQRYIAAYFYFATTLKQPWATCNPPTELEDSTCVHAKLTRMVPKVYETFDAFRWLSDKPECVWAGMFCDENRQVRAIELNGANFTGPFPEGIQHWPFLQSLGFAAGGMSGPLPKGVGTMKHLVNIELHYNEFTGTIPEEWYEARGLQRINVAANKLTGTISKEVKNLRDLKGFFAFENMLTGTIPSEFGALKSLVFVRLNRNLLTGKIPSELGNMGKQALGIWLSDNDLSGTLPTELGKMVALEDLRIHNNAKLTGDLPLGFLPYLDRLDAFNCNFTQNLTDVFPIMKELKMLRIHNNNFKGSMPEDFGVTSPGLSQLWISGNQFTGSMPTSVCDLRSDIGLDEVVADCAPSGPGLNDAELYCPPGCCTDCCDRDGGGCTAIASDEDRRL